MRTRAHHTNDGADRRMNELLERARGRAWPGPDQSPRVEEFLRGITMHARPKFTLTRSAILLVGIGAVAGGSLAAAVTHTIMNRRAVLITDDGTRYDLELVESGEGASGTFVAEDGTVFSVNTAEGDGQQQVTVDVNAPNGGTSTVILDDGSAPSVRTEPGQDAQIRIIKPTGE
ncbi:MAG: hypothetical protein IT431_16570 [Phycisphaerales bacterium]|nr:hypothetical protein [Phycisphaerales bacterium]